MQHDHPSFSENLEHIRARIAHAAAQSGRNPSEITLVAISKKQLSDSIRSLVACGQTIFGESRVQEALAKIPELPSSLQWHFIGHLQQNKIRKALPFFDLFHGIDSLEIAQQINRIAEEDGHRPRILLEVNVSGESSKFGFRPENLFSQVDQLLALPRLQIEGLMTMAPLSQDANDARPYFAKLRKLKEQLATEVDIPLAELSMGMSNDFEAAIAEGATMVRIGTAIFGSR